MDELEKGVDLSLLSPTDALRVRYNRGAQTFVLQETIPTAHPAAGASDGLGLARLVRCLQYWLGLQKAVSALDSPLLSLRDLLPDFDPYDIAHIRWAFYYLQLHTTTPSDVPLQQVQGYLAAFDHFCQLQAWRNASDLLMRPVGQTPLHEWLCVQGYAPEAVLLYEALLNKVTPEVDTLCWRGLGQAHYLLRNYPAAAQAWQAYLQQRQPSDPAEVLESVYLPLGHAQYMVGDWDGAIASWDSCLPHLPAAQIAGVSAQFYWGRAYHQLGQYAAACARLEPLLPLFRADHPGKLAEILHILGAGYVQLDRDQDAIVVWSELLAQPAAPSAELWRDLGLAYGRVGAAATAIAHLERYHQEQGVIDPEVSQALGIAYFQQADYVQAIAYLERNGAVGQDCPPWLARYLGEAYYHQRDYATAMPYLTRGSQPLQPAELPEFWLRWGHCAYELQDYAQAVHHLQLALGTGQLPGIEPLVYFRLGQAYLALAQYGDAIAPLERYLAITTAADASNTAIAATQLALGIATYHHQDLSSAEYYLQCYLAQGSTTTKAEAYFYLGNIYAQRDKPQETVSFLQQYLTLTGRVAAPLAQLQTTLFDLGVAYCRLEDYAHGLDYLQQYFALRPEHPDAPNAHDQAARFWTGWAHQRCGHYAEAIAQFEQLRSCQPDNPRIDDPALLHLGEVHLLLGHYEQATACFTDYLAAAQHRNDVAAKAQAMARLGQVFAARGDTPKALTTCQKALRLVRALETRTEEGQLLDTLGLIYQEMGDLDRAMSLHQQAWNIARSMNHQPAIAIALGHLGMTYCYLGNYTQAVKHLEQSLPLTQQLGERYAMGQMLCGLGESYTALAEYPKAQSYFEQALELARSLGVKPLEAEVQYQFARLQDSVGNMEMAMHHCEQAIELAIAGQYARLGVYWQLRDQLKPPVWLRLWRKLRSWLPLMLEKAKSI